MNKQISFKGINRATPQSDAPDGACQEIINLRYRKGAWRPVGAKAELYNATFTNDSGGGSLTFDKIYLHDVEGGPIWIGYDISADSIFRINVSTGVCYLISSAIADTDSFPVSIVFLKLTMIVACSTGVLTFMLDMTVPSVPVYNQLGALPTPNVVLSTTDYELTTFTGGISYEATAGLFYDAVNHQSSQHGRLFGSIMYMVAYRMFDGSYIMHSCPQYLNISNTGYLCATKSAYGMAAEDLTYLSVAISFNAVSGVITTIPTYDSLEGYRELIDSVVVFATKATPLEVIDKDTISALDASSIITTINTNYTLAQCFPLNPDFEDLAKSSGWYKILEYTFAEVLDDQTGAIIRVADTKGYYQDYATRKALPSDQFSHHSLAAKCSYIYNDRLHLLNIKTSYGEPEIVWPVAPQGFESSDVTAKIVVYLSTGSGKVIVIHETTLLVYIQNGISYVVLPPIVSYPDSRATKLEAAVLLDGIYKTVFSVNLTKNEGMNFAYYHRPSFAVNGGYGFNYTNYFTNVTQLGEYVTPTAQTTPYDQNRLQVSEIQNPLVFPAIYSYQIGTGEGLSMCAGSEPLSTGQFGAFPLQVFTTKGIFALSLGDSSILYANVLPVNGEVANNRLNIISIGSGVVYSTLGGLYVINGREVTQISEIVEGLPQGVASSTEINTLLHDVRCTPGLHDNLSQTDFLTFLSGSSIGFDKINNELIVTNSTLDYTYVFSFESKLWFKLSQSYSLLINNYPSLYGLTEVNSAKKVLNISSEATTGLVDCMIITCAQSLELMGVYKKIERLIARARFKTDVSMYAGLYVFASEDLVTWQIITGKQRSNDSAFLVDLVTQRSAGSAKYYIFVINGRLSIDSEIKDLDIVYIPKLANKMR